MTVAEVALRLAGRPVADAILEEVRLGVLDLPVPPQLVFVRVGSDPASEYYVRSKEKLALSAGITSRTIVLPADTPQAELDALLTELSAADDVDGILLQLPLPGHLDPQRALLLIAPDKDVDGLHPVNTGRLWNGAEGLFPCTPEGIIAILDFYGLPISGRRAVIVGRSNLVGKPAAALLLRRDATVTLAHSRTADLGNVTREADILIGAVGVPGLITPDMVRPGAVVLDVGLTRVDGKVVGDVDPRVARVASALTPMPGGTGLVTVAMVIRNTLAAATARHEARRLA
jgi:methylenetetrahydrofolate dehydrogenase (NADP+)/methenyltetrahydrofolate cyclohydrolase